jgi:predicted ABC-type ATPase
MTVDQFLKPFPKLDRATLDQMMAELKVMVKDDAELLSQLGGEKKLSIIRFAHAPAGGVTIQGKFFKGGQFIPSEVLEEATAEEIAAVEGGEAEEEAEPKERDTKPSSIQQGESIKPGETVSGFYSAPHRSGNFTGTVGSISFDEAGGNFGRQPITLDGPLPGREAGERLFLTVDGRGRVVDKRFQEPKSLEDFTSEDFTPLNPEGKFTWDQFQDDQGKGSDWLLKEMDEGRFYWTEERKQLHTKIVESFFEGVTPVEKPAFHMMGGGPASGKSSVLKAGLIELPENQLTVDADEIKSKLPEYREMLEVKDKAAAGFAHEESSYLAKEIMARSLKEGLNTNLDGTGDGGYDGLKKKIRDARAAGMPVTANYMTIETETSWAISKKRFEATGRFVPEKILRNTHKKVSQILPQAMEDDLFDDVSLWDNNVKDEPVLVMRKKQGQPPEILDKAMWERFLAKADE